MILSRSAEAVKRMSAVPIAACPFECSIVRKDCSIVFLLIRTR